MDVTGSEEVVSTATENYLKVIWAAREWTSRPVTISALAERLGVAPSTVSEAVKRLTNQGLVTHVPYGSIELTPSGYGIAVMVVRRHRLLETFLFEYLGYAWDEVHDEAEVMEHAVSDRLVERLDDLLGRPARDPHGDPIPGADGTLPALDAIQLSDVTHHNSVIVARVSDVDPEALRYLAGIGVGLDTEVAVLERREFAGDLSIRVRGETKDIGLRLARAIWVCEQPERSP